MRESELEKIRNGDLMSKKKPKATAKTKKVAFTQYMKMFYDKPKPTVSLCKYKEFLKQWYQNYKTNLFSSDYIQRAYTYEGIINMLFK